MFINQYQKLESGEYLRIGRLKCMEGRKNWKIHGSLLLNKLGTDKRNLIELYNMVELAIVINFVDRQRIQLLRARIGDRIK
jgi:hypothetical protein